MLRPATFPYRTTDNFTRTNKATGATNTEPSYLAQFIPPVRNIRFWYVQLLIFLIAGTHTVVELLKALPSTGGLHYLPVSLFLLPVIYTAFNFGFSGTVATALWATVLTIPSAVFLHSDTLPGEIFQLLLINIVAVFVGYGVELENRARRQAEEIGAALRASESRYRELFEMAGEAVLVIDGDGIVREVNTAASRLFNSSPEQLRGSPLSTLLGNDATARLLVISRECQPCPDLVIRRADGRSVSLQPVTTSFTDPKGNRFTQVILRDVTEQRWQEAGLRNYAAHILRAQEEERKRIAQELHDDAIQSIILLCRQLDDVETLAKRTSPEMVDHLNRTREKANELANSLRRFTQGLRPSVLDDLGLVPAIRRLATNLAEQAGVQVNFEVTGNLRRLSRDAEVGLFRIAQEALRNVERHANASSVRVNVDFQEAVVNLTVEDDGRGFKLPVPGEPSFADAGRLGLVGIEERARLLGGSLSVRSAPGTGTTLKVSVPVQ